MADLPHVTWLRAFEAAARHSSFSAAAAELGLTPAAISQQIRLLEKHLKTQLFERRPRGVVLTDLGQAYAQPVRKSFADMAAATDGLFSTQPRRLLRVRASISCAALVIAPQLHLFHAQHPDVFVQLSTAVWADRFDEEMLDIDIRYGHGQWGENDIRHLGHEYAIPVCSRQYADRLGGAVDIETLAAAQVVQIIGSELDWRKLADHHALNFGVQQDWMRVDSSLIAQQIVMGGQGVTMVLENFARQYIEQGLLIAPVAHRLPKKRSHYVVVRDGVEMRGEVNLFCNWVQGLYQA
jgi:LysR family glycine cleavage system transcriptional activator